MMGGATRKRSAVTSLTLAVVLILFLLLAAGVAFYLVRGRGSLPPPELARPEAEIADDHEERAEAIRERGEELLERRVDLDARRGTLGGRTDVYEAFEDLEQRLRSGEISEDEFEHEKVRLLGG